MFVDVLNDPFVHQQNVGPSTHVRVDCHREDEFVVLPVEVVEVVHPNCFYISRIDPSVTIGTLLDEPITERQQGLRLDSSI